MQTFKLESKDDKDGFLVSVWNREYEFYHSILPCSIRINKEEILYSPMKMSAVFGSVEGQWTGHTVIPMEKGKERCVYSIAQETENLIVNADVVAEYDGMLQINFRLIPYWSFSNDRIPRLTGFSMDIPIKKEYAGLVHFWPNCDSGVCLSHKVLNSLAMPEKLVLPFKPYLWAGWEYGGLGICCESAKNFELIDDSQCITIEDRGEYVNIHIALLEQCPASWDGREDQWGDTIEPINFSFGIQATPVKPFWKQNTTEWRALHLYDVEKYPIYECPDGSGNTMLEKIAASGAKWLILHEDWSLIQNYGVPKDKEEFLRFADACHKLGLKLMVYFGYEISTLMPGFLDVCEEALNKNVNGNYVGGWQRKPAQRDFTVCYKGSYSDTMIERVAYVMDELKVDGIYTDGTYVPWECANEAHGCGYRDADGQLHDTYPIWAVRKHVKRLYECVHQRGGIIDTHQSSCCMMMTLAFADSYFDGENIQGMVAENIGSLKLDSFRCEFMGLNMGIPCNFISYVNEKFTMRSIAGITLLHNVFPRGRTLEDLKFMSDIWKIYDDFGVENATWHPYWEQTDIVCPEKKNVYISYFENNGNYLLMMFSLEKEGGKVCFTIPQSVKITDLLDLDKIRFRQDGMAEVSLTYGGNKILLVERNEKNE